MNLFWHSDPEAKWVDPIPTISVEHFWFSHFWKTFDSSSYILTVVKLIWKNCYLLLPITHIYFSFIFKKMSDFVDKNDKIHFTNIELTRRVPTSSLNFHGSNLIETLRVNLTPLNIFHDLFQSKIIFIWNENQNWHVCTINAGYSLSYGNNCFSW